MTTATFNASYAANRKPSLLARLTAWFKTTNTSATWADGARGM